MITGNIRDCEKYYRVHKSLKMAFDFLKTVNEDTPQGSYVLEENSVRVNVSGNVEPVDGYKPFEAHRDFIDVHFIVKGAEKFGYSNVNKLKVTKDYDEKEDYMLLSGDVDSVTLSKGDFCMVFPEDAHIPCIEKCSEEQLKRAVVKIRL